VSKTAKEETLKLGKYDKPINLTKLKEVLKKARFITMAIITEENGSVDPSIILYSHGKWTDRDGIEIIEALGEKFGLVIPVIAINAMKPDLLKKPNVRYIA